MSASTFEIDILLFGPAAMTAGCSSVRVACADGLTCDALLGVISEQHASIASIVEAGRLAVNGAYVDGSVVINQSDEIALVSLVSGG